MERLGYRHLSDFLRDHSSAELTGLFEYLHADDEMQMNWLIYAIVRAFNGDKAKPNTFDGEEVIDTTASGFAEQFQGFSNTPGGRQPLQGIPQRSTEIKFG